MELLLPNEHALRGIEHFISNYIELGPDDGVIISFADPCSAAVAWLLMALTLYGQPHLTYRLQHRDDAVFEEALERMIAKLRQDSRVRRVIILVCEDTTLSFTLPLKRRARQPDLVIWRLLNCTPDLFELAFETSREDLMQVNAGLLTRLMPAQFFRITDEIGTDLEVENDSERYQWVSNHGTPGPGELIVLPAGEVNIFPASISGRFVAQGALNCNFPIGFDVRLQDRPVTFEIEDGMVRHFDCEDREVLEFLKHIFDQPFSRNIGELGFGTNLGVDRFVAANSHINERHPGVHLGFGQHGQPGRVDYDALVHLDAISAHEIIHVQNDGATIHTDALEPILVPHPKGTHCEDIEHSF